MDTKKLRQKILDLAIHGKLVPQDPNDEPASVLLERIRAEKERLVKEGKIKKSKTSKTSDTPHYEQVPFEVPDSWEWTTVGEICFFENGYAFSSDDYTTSGIPLIRISNIKDNQISTENCVYIQGDYEDKFQICNGDLLIAMSGATTGKMGFYLSNKKAYLNQRVGNIKVIDSQSLCLEYRNLFLRSKSEEILKLAYGGAQPNISGAMISSLQVPLPPISEQYRIVAETERWFALIELIEQGKADLQTTIKQAKSKILDLAIHGKLVPQDPNEEPASELLKRINPKAEITCDNGQYGKIPENWCVTKLGDISNYGENENIQVEDIDSNEWVLELEDIEKDSANIIQILKKHERCINGIRHKFTKGNILYSKLRTYLNKVLIAPKDGYCTTEVMAFNALGGMSNEYICHVLRSSYFLDYTLQCGYGVKMPRLSTTDACNGLIPLPPLAEQQRIVDAIDKAFAKLDAIMESL